MALIFRKYRVVFFLLFPLISIGQNNRTIDSLVRALTTSTSDTGRCRTLNNLFVEYVRSDLKKAAFYNEQALKLAGNIHYAKGITEAINNRSHLLRLRGKYDSAMLVLESAKPEFKALPDKIAYADYLSDLGSLYALKNDQKTALITLFEALDIYRSTGSNKNLALLYNRLGSIYQAQKQFDSTLHYFNKSLEINNATGFKLGSSVNLINIGTVYADKGDQVTAIKYFREAMELKVKLNDKHGIMKCLNNIGAAYMNTGKVREAILNHEKALALARDFNSNIDLALGYTNLGFDYQKENNYQRAIFYAGKGLALSRQLNDYKLIRESSRVLFECYYSLKNFEEAYRYHVLFKQYSDSTVNENNLKEMAEIQTKYAVVSKQNEITALKSVKDNQELQIQTMRAWYSLAIGIFVALLAMALFFFNRSRNSRKISLKLREINDMKSHFFANLSHEFRTPLTLMLGPAEKLMETATPGDKPWLELIHRNASRLLFLDEQLLEFTKIDSGTQKIHLVTGNILIPLRSIAESYTLFAGQKNIEYSIDLPGEAVEVYFDPDILEKVTGNLLSNAFKYTPAGQAVKLTVSVVNNELPPKNAGMNHPAAGSYIRIDVGDTGSGIPEAKKEVIFERFFQLNHNPGNTVGGVGIGLALTRELLTLHHGFITLESTEGIGSRFSVLLPADPGIYSKEEMFEVRPYKPAANQMNTPGFAEEAVLLNDLQEPETPDTPGEKELPLVLVVDDNADMRSYIKKVLHLQYTLSDAENGDTGFEIACATVPDLILTDVMMYPVNGIELCRRLKQDERTSHIPVIMLTALTASQEKIEGLETGADDYITKPFSHQELLVRIKNLISQRMKLRQLFSSSMNFEPKAISVTSADEKFLNKLVQLIESNIDNSDLDTDFLLNNIPMSRSQLHRKIKGLTDQPITGFIRIIRIKRAAQLLEQKFGNVSDVMYAVGFSNLSYFTKSFREVYNMTPSEFMSK
ncbi:MAG: tetratricopeptide repeat protein [Bacteroidetes bacterium]|nr:tetratricopeptide repeat protein [Bacteroidota bacterium]